MPHRWFIILLALLLPATAVAQLSGPVAGEQRVFVSWEPAAFADQAPPVVLLGVSSRSKDRVGNALLGGTIGAVAGVAFCTVVSNIVKDEGTGFSTCTTSGYLLTGGIGFGLGFIVGWSV
jgi:hypothetical protein